MRILLDTNVIIEELRGTRVLERLSARSVPVVSAVTVMELHALPGLSALEESQITDLTRLCIVLPIDETVAVFAGRLKRTRPKRSVADLLIAATATTHDLLLCTRNVRDFRDIPGLVTLKP